MTGRDEDDPRDRRSEFVAARWSSLEAVAVVATLDVDDARRLTLAAFREVHRRWARLVDEGSPTTAARTALLTEVAGVRQEDRDVDPLLAGAVADDAVPAALLAVLARETPVVRAWVAATSLWDLRPDEATALFPRRTTADLASAGTVRDRLLTAHREARAAEGFAPDDDRLGDDLADLLHRLADAPAEPSDPAGLVDADGTTGPGRRLALSGVAGAAALGVAGWLVLDRRTSRPVPVSGPTPAASASPSPPPDSPLWDTALTWPARGSLATERRVSLLVATAGPGARLLFADDVAGARLVAATDPSTDLGSDTTAVRWWRGPAGTPPEQLAVASVGLEMLDPDPQKVAYGGRLPSGDSLVLVLGRPTVADAEVSLRVTPTVDGQVRRTWEPLRLADGVGWAVFPEPLGPAARLRFDGYDGGLPVVLLDAAADGIDPLGTVASATGIDRDRLVSSIDVRPLPSSIRVAGDQRIYVATTTIRLPSGAVVRSTEIGDAGRSFSIGTGGARVVPASSADGPVVTSFYDEERSAERLLVTVDPRATTLRASVGTSPSVTAPVTDGVAVVDLADGSGAPPVGLRVRAIDARGRVLTDGTAFRGVPFLDLAPNEVASVT